MADAIYTDEIWKIIPFAPEYSASNYGRIKRSKFSPYSRINGPLSDRAKDKDGYTKVTLVSSKRISTKFHTCVCAAFHGPKPSPLHCVAHADGDISNNTPQNLRWATMAENGMDKRRHGRAKGERNHQAKITSSDVSMMRDLHAKGMAPKQLMERFDLSRSQVCRILRWESWR